MMTISFDTIKQRMADKEQLRIVAFGSSNTERYLPGMHWFDCLELAIVHTYGRVHRCINSGWGGNTVRDLKRRFERDAAFYKPDMVVITIGGNDTNPDKKLGPDEYKSSLLDLQQQFQDIGAFVIFQTYYAPIHQEEEKVRLKNFEQYMQLVRDVAAETGSGLIDQLIKWNRLRLDHPQKHLELMRDPWHVTPLGNMVMGLTIADYFESDLPGIFPDDFKEAKTYYDLMS